MATRTRTRRLAGRNGKKTATKRPLGRASRATTRSTRSGGVTRKEPETLRLRTVTPTYTVNDLQESIAWYRDGLGFVVTDRWESSGKLEGVMLKAGTCEFGLSQDDFKKGRSREKGIGFRIYADTTQDVDKLADRVRDYGGKIIQEPTNTPWGRMFSAEDPDGFRISISRKL